MQAVDCIRCALRVTGRDECSVRLHARSGDERSIWGLSRAIVAPEGPTRRLKGRAAKLLYLICDCSRHFYRIRWNRLGVFCS